MTIDPTEQAIRDELPREVLSYAEGLRRQMYEIARRYGVEKPADIGPKMASGEVSLADMERMVELKRLLEQVVKEKAIPRSETQGRKRVFLSALEDFVETYREIRNDRPGSKPNADPAIPPAWSQDLADAVDRMPPIPLEELLRNSRMMNEVIDALRGNLSKDDGIEAVGLVASMIMNRSIAGVSEELRSGIKQTIDGLRMRDIGYGWRGGELTVLGNAGDGLGAEMFGGRIVADHAEHYVGARMSGGEIRVRRAVNRLGWEMTGGKIDVGACLEAGTGMSGGLIRAGAARMSVGHWMTGGEIEFGRDKRALVSGDEGDLPTPSMLQNWNGGDVGKGMRGGLIRVNVDAYSAGSDMLGGSILIRGTIDYIAKRWIWNLMERVIHAGGNLDPVLEFPRHGGTIRYEGKGSWWKNALLFLTSGRTRD